MPILQKARQNVWPTAVLLHIKLYGSWEELEKTATFVLQTGLSTDQDINEDFSEKELLT